MSRNIGAERAEARLHSGRLARRYVGDGATGVAGVASTAISSCSCCIAEQASNVSARRLYNLPVMKDGDADMMRRRRVHVVDMGVLLVIRTLQPREVYNATADHRRRTNQEVIGNSRQKPLNDYAESLRVVLALITLARGLHQWRNLKGGENVWELFISWVLGALMEQMSGPC